METTIKRAKEEAIKNQKHLFEDHQEFAKNFTVKIAREIVFLFIYSAPYLCFLPHKTQAAHLQQQQGVV